MIGQPTLPNYSIDIPAPYQEMLKGYMTGMALEEKRQAQQAQMQQQAQMRELYAKLGQPGVTAQDYARLTMGLPPDQAKSVREGVEMMTTAQQQEAINSGGQIFSAFRAGKPDIAIGLLDQQIAAKRNSGDEQGAKSLETWRDVARENPKAAETFFGFGLSIIPGGDKVIEAATKVGGMDADAAFSNAMKGVTTVEQMYERIPALATMGEKGLEFANKLLTQQRLAEQAREAGITAEQQRDAEREQAVQAAGMLRVLFPGAVSSMGGAEGEARPINVATVGDIIRVDEAAVGDIIKSGGYQVTEQQRNALGLNPETEGLIRMIAQTDPKGAGKLMMNIINQKIKRDLTPAKADKLPSSAQEFALASGLQPGTPEFQRGYTAHLRQQKSGQNINIALPAAEKAAGAEAGKLFDAWYDSATAGNQQLRDMDIYERSIANAITGPFANTRMKATQIASMLGFGGEDAVSSTRELIQGLSEMTLGARGMLKGQGTITDAEQRLLAQARGGNIDMTGAELKTLFRVIRRGVTAKTERDTRMLKRAADKGSEIAQMYLDEVMSGQYHPPEQPAPVSVTAPNGQVLTFPNQQAADAFKKAAGIR